MPRGQQRRSRNGRVVTRANPWLPPLLDWQATANNTASVAVEVFVMGGDLVLSGVPKLLTFPGLVAPVSASILGPIVTLTYPVNVPVGTSFIVREWLPELRSSFGAFMTQKIQLPPVPGAYTYEWAMSGVVGAGVEVTLPAAHSPYTLAGTPNITNRTTAEFTSGATLAGDVMTVNFASGAAVGDEIVWPTGDVNLTSVDGFFNGFSIVRVPA